MLLATFTYTTILHSTAALIRLAGPLQLMQEVYITEEATEVLFVAIIALIALLLKNREVLRRRRSFAIVVVVLFAILNGVFFFVLLQFLIPHDVILECVHQLNYVL